MLTLFLPVVLSCAPSKIEQENAVCNGASNLDVDVDYGLIGENIKICIRNNRDNGWLAVGPGAGMQGDAVGAWAGGGTGTFALSGRNINYGSQLVPMNSVSIELLGRRVLCFEMPRFKISGTETAASFQWAMGPGFLTRGERHTRRGTVLLNLVEAAGGFYGIDEGIVWLIVIAFLFAVLFMGYHWFKIPDTPKPKVGGYRRRRRR